MLAGVLAIHHCMRSRFLIRLTRRLFWGPAGDDPTNVVVRVVRITFRFFPRSVDCPVLSYPQAGAPCPRTLASRTVHWFGGLATTSSRVRALNKSPVSGPLWTCERGMAWIPPQSNTPPQRWVTSMDSTVSSDAFLIEMYNARVSTAYPLESWT